MRNHKVESEHTHLQVPNAEFWTFCKLHPGGHVGLNHKILQRASTTGVVWLLCQVSLISDEPVLRNLWSHTGISKFKMLNFELFANCILVAILDYIAKLFNVHQLQVLCDYCTRFHWFQINQCWETFDHIDACPKCGRTTDDERRTTDTAWSL